MFIKPLTLCFGGEGWVHCGQLILVIKCLLNIVLMMPAVVKQQAVYFETPVWGPSLVFGAALIYVFFALDYTINIWCSLVSKYSFYLAFFIYKR